MSERKKTPFAPATAPAAGMSSCVAPPFGTTWLFGCAAGAANAAVAHSIVSAKRNRFMIFKSSLDFVSMRPMYGATAFFVALTSSAFADPISIRAARVLDGRGKVMQNAAVVVDGGKIIRIDSAPKRADIDLGDRTLMPGGIDTHVHIGWHFDAKDGRSHADEADRGESAEEGVLYAAENGWRTLMGGITTVQSLGAPVDRSLRDAVARGVLPGPRILTAFDPIADAKLTPEQMREAVRKLVEERADVVKVFASQSIRTGGAPTLTQEQLDAICSEAKAHG